MMDDGQPYHNIRESRSSRILVQSGIDPRLKSHVTDLRPISCFNKSIFITSILRIQLN